MSLAAFTLEQAAILRPIPKWQEIAPRLPTMEGLDVLEIGSNCGFFSFKFAEAKARSVLGLDVADHWPNNARWVASVLGHTNVRFENCDFMLFDPDCPATQPGLLSNASTNIPLPNDRFDLVFSSTVLDHLFFPLFAIYKMIRIARKWVVIDMTVCHHAPSDRPFLHLSTSPDFPHHGFTATQPSWRPILKDWAFPRQRRISTASSTNGNSIVYIIDTNAKNPGLVGA
jgi:SAM-dependent methyltransferase